MAKALISTVSSDGGVSTMANFVAGTLLDAGIEPVVAHYQPYSLSPELSVPTYSLLHRRVGSRKRAAGRCERHEIGAWLPELEFTHYLPTRQWRELISQADFHLTVSGNCLPATPFALRGIPYWAWIATPWDEDRKQRAQAFSLPRKLFDLCITARGARRLQRKVLNSGTIMALSEYTKARLRVLAPGNPDIGVMPMGIDTERFKPARAPRAGGGRVGFVGRLSDPRKNVELLARTAAWCRDRYPGKMEFVLIGGDGAEIRGLISRHQLQDSVTLVDNIDNEELPNRLNTFDVFVIPSHQEGLCIAALEAMSCGVPVVSTPCGGPEEFVLEGETGFLSEPRPEALGKRIADVALDPDFRTNLGANARRLVKRKYSTEAVRNVFWRSFEHAFGEKPVSTTAKQLSPEKAQLSPTK